MTNKEYKARLEDHYIIDAHGYGVGCYGPDYIDRDAISALSRDITNRKKSGDIVLDGFNRRASITPINGGYILTSYYTVVAEFTEKGGFKKRWQGFSATTLKHINIFRQFVGLAPLNKREWIELDAA